MGGILEVPNEIIDKCVKELLPPLPGAGSPNSLEPFLVPRDLLNCRLVCQRLELLARPLAWSRLYIGHDRGREVVKDDIEDASAFFAAHPRLAGEVRRLQILPCSYLRRHFELEITPRLPVDSMEQWTADRTVKWPSGFTWVEDPGFDLLPALSLMGNIQVITLHYLPNAEIFTELLQKPRLHTASILLCNLVRTGEPLARGTIKHLSIQVRRGVRDVLEITPRLVSLQLHEDPFTFPTQGFGPETWPIPWETLREITITRTSSSKVYLASSSTESESTRLWVSVSEAFLGWKARTVDKLSPLIELHIHDNCGIRGEDMDFLLSSFMGQSLQKLSLSNVGLDIGLLRRIVDAFPQLEELGLVTTDSEAWTKDLPQMASTLDRLRHLKTVEWSCGLNLDDQNPLLEEHNVVEAFAQGCPHLTRIRFPTVGSPSSTLTVDILRDELGQYVKGEFHRSNGVLHALSLKLPRTSPNGYSI